MERTVSGVHELSGVVRPPGDKSISHRAVLLAAIAEGQSRIDGFGPGDDSLATVRCMRGLGAPVEIDRTETGVVIDGVGLRGLREPDRPLDCGNSGTSMRLLAGLLAGQPFFSVLTGDDSLRSRPMARVAEPLRAMGAVVLGRDDGRLAPLAVRGGRLRGVAHRIPVASAQVKSALLLAGLYAEGETVVTEPAPSRDHTERMLVAMGAPIVVDGATVSIKPPERALEPLSLSVPGDFSAAAVWLVAGSCVEGAELRVTGVGVNPTRTGALDVLRAMGAEIALTGHRIVGGEPVADIAVRASRLGGVEVSGDLVPRLIDEIPLLALAATQAKGTSVFRDASELRLKESDRIATTVAELRRLGAEIDATPDGMVVRGRPGSLRGSRCDSHGDHRLAMTLAVAGLVARGDTIVEGAEAVTVSYRKFWQQLGELTGRVAA